LDSGYNGGTWNGPGIISSSAAAANGAFAIGYADGNVDSLTAAAPNQILLKYTLAGDANLDGTVNITDLLILLNNYGDTGQDWADGDFNYDGAVNVTDLLAMLNNYPAAGGTSTFALSASERRSEASSTIAVPEPAAASFIGLGSAALLARRRRKRV
jgi:Dockerin type I domain